MNTHSCGAVIVPGQVICSGCLASLLDAPIGPQPPAAEPFQPAPPSSSTPSFAPLSPRVEEPSVSAAAGPRRLRHPEGWCSGPSNLTATTCDVCGTPLIDDAPNRNSGHLVLPGGITIPVLPGQPVELGRATGRPDIDAVLGPIDTVSRRHLSLVMNPQSVVVVDLGSTNGTTVDGERATPRVERPLRELTIGLGTSVTVRFIPPPGGMP